jgi:hypothetical protein
LIGAALLVLGATFALAACGLGDDESNATESTDIGETAPIAAESIEQPASLTECPTTNVADDLDLSGNCTIGPTVVVSGSVAIKDGALVVLGTVDGSVNQSGSGGVAIGLQGFVMGDINEANEGAVRFEGGTATGSVTESGQGAVILETGSVVEGSVAEGGRGNVRIRVGARVGAGITESGRGDCQISDEAEFGGPAADGCA